MKLSDLILHTSSWIGIAHTQVRTVAHELRPVGLISSAGRGTGGAEMTADDKINLLLGVCGVEVAKRAAEHVRVWRRLIRYDNAQNDYRFAFTQAKTVKDFFIGLITEDLNGGSLDAWLKETSDDFDQLQGHGVRSKSDITLDFYVDEFRLTLAVSRHRLYADDRTEADTINVDFWQPPPDADKEYVHGIRDQGYKAGSALIRRLHEKNLRGWGTCLIEAAA